MPCFEAEQPAPPSSSPPGSESWFVMCHILNLTNRLLPLPPSQEVSPVSRPTDLALPGPDIPDMLLVFSCVAPVRSSTTLIHSGAYIMPLDFLWPFIVLLHPFHMIAYTRRQMVYMFSPGVKEPTHHSSYHTR